MNRNDCLRQEREKRGWSQARVAEQIETDAINVSRWERGQVIPSPYFREKLCNLFGKSALDLGFIQDERPEDVPKPSSPPPITENTGPQTSPLNPLSKNLATLSYLLGWISGLFIFLLNEDDGFVRFHSRQSLLFFGASNALSLILILPLLFLGKGDKSTLISLASIILVLSLILLNAFTLIVWIAGILQAKQGKYYRFPFIAK